MDDRGGVAPKQELLAQFREHLLDLRETIQRNLHQARGGIVVSGEERPRNRGERAAVTSQGYLLQVLNQRLAALDRDLALLDMVESGPATRVRAGAMVSVQHGSSRRRYLFLPGGDGCRLDTPGGTVTVLSPGSPLGRALAGLEPEDETTSPSGEDILLLEVS